MRFTFPFLFPALCRTCVLAAVIVTALPAAAGAQQPARTAAGAETLESRMQAFSRALGIGMDTAHVELFPRRGHWTWVHTSHYPDGDRVGLWRFRTSDIPAAMARCGPLNHSFKLEYHGHPPGRLLLQVFESGGEWRRSGRSRFVIDRSDFPTTAFVEWRREDGRWVVSAFGDESFHGPRLLGVLRGMIVRDTTSPMPRRDYYATGTSWYEQNVPITFEGRRYLKYGRPRPIARDLLTWIARLGAVRVYTQRGVPPGQEEIVYIPAGPDEYQPYETHTPTRCPR